MASCCRRNSISIPTGGAASNTPVTPHLVQSGNNLKCNICNSPLFLKKRVGDKCIMQCTKCNIPYPRNCA